jgi:hypothetical protein
MRLNEVVYVWIEEELPRDFLPECENEGLLVLDNPFVHRTKISRGFSWDLFYPLKASL